MMGREMAMDLLGKLRTALARLVRALPWLGLGAALLVVQCARPGVFESVDFVRFHVLNQEYLWGAVRSGRLPLWNPHVALGRPFLADPESAFFYPPYWLHLVLSPRAAVAILLAAHSALGLWGTGRLARALGIRSHAALVPGLLFFASGTVVELVAAGQILYYAGICYLPLALLASLRLQQSPSLRRVAGLGAILALQILASHPQMFWITCVASAVLVIAVGLERPWLGSLRALVRVLLGQMTAIALALTVAAIQLLPFLELIEQGNRQARTIDFASGWSLPAYALASLAYPIPVANWSDNLYGGSLLALAGLGGLVCVRGRTSRAPAVLALLGVTVALGTATPIFGLAFHTLPGLAFFRIPGRMALVTLLALALAAGMLLDRMDLRSHTSRVVAILGTLLVGAAALDPMGRDAVPAWLRALALGATAALLVVWTDGRLAGRRIRVAVALLAVLTLAELGQGARVAKSVVAAPPEYPVEEQARAALARAALLAPDAAPPRVSIPFPMARENAGMHHGWSTFSGYVGLWLERTWSYVHMAVGLEVPTRSVAFPASNVYQGAFPYDGVSLVLGIDPSGRGGLRPISDPRVYIAQAALVVPHWRDAIVAMRQGHDYHRVALVERALPELPAVIGDGGAGQAHIVHFAPERIEIAANTPAPGLLVLAESYYPGWTATVDGNPAPCVPANGWMRAVPLPPGRTSVVLTFKSTRLAQGAVISTLALVLLALLAFAGPRFVAAATGLGSGSRHDLP